MPAHTKDSIRIGLTAGKILKRLHPRWSVDELLIHPTEALALCDDVRDQMSIERSNEDILRALVNARKQGRVHGIGRKSA